MPLTRLLDITLWILAIEVVGSLIIVGYVIAAVIALIRSRDIRAARLLVAQGAITGLDYKLAATLLKTLVILSWNQILAFAAILALRTMLKRLFTWEQQRLTRGASAAPSVSWVGRMRMFFGRVASRLARYWRKYAPKERA